MGGLSCPKRLWWVSFFFYTRAMNNVLLAKWIFKLDKGGNNMALEVVRRKYLEDKSFCQSKQRGSSQFCQGLEKAREWYEKGTRWKVGNGKKVRFWHDIWLGNCPLKIEFPRLQNQQTTRFFCFRPERGGLES